MADRVITVKMPSGLVAALASLREQHHYLDLSEQLRSVVRQRCLELTNPYTAEIQRLRKDIAGQTETAKTAREQILRDIMRMLREGDS